MDTDIESNVDDDMIEAQRGAKKKSGGTAKSFLAAKCFQRLNKYSETGFTVKFICPVKASDEGLHSALALMCEHFGITADIFETDEPYDTSALCAKAKELHCNKLSLPDCFDDCTEHILLNTLYNGRLEALVPKGMQNGIEVIRPCVLIRRADIESFARYIGADGGFPLKEEPDDKTAYIRALIDDLAKTNQNLEINILRSCEDVNPETLISYIQNGERKSVLDTF